MLFSFIVKLSHYPGRWLIAPQSGENVQSTACACACRRGASRGFLRVRWM